MGDRAKRRLRQAKRGLPVWLWSDILLPDRWRERRGLLMSTKMTAPKVLARKGGNKLCMITAYDYPSARIADRAGADIVLVGDSLANVVLGHKDTLRVTLDQLIHHTKAVSAAEPTALIVGDMPWLSYHMSIEETVRNAGRLVQEGGAEAVKLEGGWKRLAAIRAVLDAEIPIQGHLGLTPQSLHAMGGYRVQGKQAAAAYQLISDAKELANAGVFSIVLESVPDVVAEIITAEVPVPIIGIGAGKHCDGQVLVFHDMLGFGGSSSLPKFVRQYASLADDAVDAVEHFFSDVRSGEFPGDDETYHMAAVSEEVLHVLTKEQASDLLADEAMEA